MSFEQVVDNFLAPADMQISDLESQLSQISGAQIDYADFYFQAS